MKLSYVHDTTYKYGKGFGGNLNYNIQISNKIKSQVFGILNLGHCDLFGICDLFFEIF